MQLNIVRVVGCQSLSVKGEEVITMETFLEIIREIFKGIVREITAHFFRKKVLEYKKTTLRRRKLKGGSRKN
jgi:hypothetical protein